MRWSPRTCYAVFRPTKTNSGLFTLIMMHPACDGPARNPGTEVPRTGF